jgi:hypothetical protein
MNWIRMAVAMKGDASVHLLAERTTRGDVPKAIGHIQCVLSELPAHARDGNLRGTPDTLLEQWAMWTGKRGEFAAAFRDILCTDGMVSAWDRHNGAAIRDSDGARERMKAKRQLEREEKSRQLEAKKQALLPASFGEPFGERSQNVRDVFPSDGTGRDGTNYSSTEIAAVVVTGQSSGSSGGDVVGLLEPTAAGIYAGLRRSHRDPLAFDAMVRAAVEPITGGVRFTWLEASAAIVQLRGTGREVTTKLLRAFMADARKRPDASSDRARPEADPWFHRSQELSKLRAQNEYLIDDCRPHDVKPEPEWAAEADRRYPPRKVA